MDNIENFTKEEERANAILHGAGLVMAIAALAIMMVFACLYGNVMHIVTFAVYGSTSVLLYLASTLYHSFPQGKMKDLFEILDHACIFIFIAGAYTPFTLVSIKGTLGWTLFGIIWGIGIVGIVFKIFFVKKFVVLSTLLYIAMGWMAVFAVKPLLASMSIPGLILLLAGGLSYTFGTIFYIWRKLKYHHAIWHLFVLGGSICHFFTVLLLLPAKI